jgi:hypothetical protein
MATQVDRGKVLREVTDVVQFVCYICENVERARRWVRRRYGKCGYLRIVANFAAWQWFYSQSNYNLARSSWIVSRMFAAKS